MTRREILSHTAGALLVPPTLPEGEIPLDSNLQLTLTGAIAAKGRAGKEKGDLELELQRRGGIWQPQAWGFAYDYNTADHYGPAGVAERRETLNLEIRLAIGDDPWVPGNAAIYRLVLKRRKNQVAGTYHGTFGSKQVRGAVQGTITQPYPQPPPREFTPAAPGEHPRLVFRQSDLPRLRERLQTSWGAAIVERLRECLRQELRYVGDYGANSAYFAAGQGFLSLLTGERPALDAATAITAESMRTVPMRKGHQYAYSHHLHGLALAYDFCYSAWSEDFRQEVVRYLEQTSALVIAGRGPGFNHSPGSNWMARTRGGAGVALLAIAGDTGATGQVPHLLTRAQRGVARYLLYGTGNRGFGPEGDGYHVESMEMVLAFLEALRIARGEEMARGPQGEGAAWTLPLYLLRSYPADDGPRLHRYGRHGEASRITPRSLFSLGIGSAVEAHRPAIGAFIARYWGLEGDRSFAIALPHHAPYMLARYPVPVKTGEATTGEAKSALPATLQDSRKGFYLFRNSDFVATIYAKTSPAYGWNFPEAGGFRLHGLGTDWVIRAAVGAREEENVVVRAAGETGSKRSQAEGKGPGKVLFYQARPDGSGTLSLDLGGLYDTAKITAQRAFLIDYSGASGAPALLALRDRIEGPGDWTWLLHTGGETVVIGKQGFTIGGKNGATLTATFVSPVPVELAVHQRGVISTIQARPLGMSSPQTVRAQTVRGGIEFAVVITVQPGVAPPVSITGEGNSQVVRVGGQVVRLEESSPGG